jgi:muramoyltetrapeptide carboxypeptidase
MVLKPPALQKGDLIGLVSPASAPSSHEMIERGVRYLERIGYRVKVGQHAARVHGYLAGTDDQRAADFNGMIRDKFVKAIIAVRGGYGTPRILPLLDYRTLRHRPKIIVGYSDLTALQLAVFHKTCLVTFSGPMSGVEMSDGIDPYTEEHFWRILTSSKKLGELKNPGGEPLKVLHSGNKSGRILGGNLATAISLLKTPFAPDFARSILVLEDVDEAPHRVDRMLAQLCNARILEKLSGLVFGKFVNCVPSDPNKPFIPVDEVLMSVAKDVKCPVLANLQYGHLPRKLTVPLGVRGRIDSKRGVLELTESAVM